MCVHTLAEPTSSTAASGLCLCLKRHKLVCLTRCFNSWYEQCYGQTCERYFLKIHHLYDKKVSN